MLSGSLKKPLNMTATPRALNLGATPTPTTSSSIGGMSGSNNNNSVKSRPSSRQASRPGSRFGTPYTLQHSLLTTPCRACPALPCPAMPCHATLILMADLWLCP
jgi:hypothetical protein